MTDTIFGKIIAGDIPADKIYEDEHCIAINDINPQAPVHVLVIPKRAIPKLADATQDDRVLLGHLLLVAKKLALDLGLADGFRVIINNGEGGGQTVFHLHLHVIGGFRLGEGMV
ncbi:MAG: histidine triad nucleotide-binding protein [Pseudomonadales bacterium]